MLALPLLRQEQNSPSLSGRRARRARRTWQRPTLNIRSSSWRTAYPSTAAKTVVDVAWEGHHRQTSFQEGAALPPPEDRADVFARYGNGDIAAARYDHGDGMAGLVGPHPEADQTWLDKAGIADPDRDDWNYAVPFVAALLD